MTPAERAVAWGLVRGPAGTSGALAWYAGALPVVAEEVGSRPPRYVAIWRTVSYHATEDAALTAYLDAVGAP